MLICFFSWVLLISCRWKIWSHIEKILICSAALVNLRISCRWGRRMSKVSLVVPRHFELSCGPHTKCSWHLKYAVRVNCWQQELCISPAEGLSQLVLAQLLWTAGCGTGRTSWFSRPISVPRILEGNLLCHREQKTIFLDDSELLECCSTARMEFLHVPEVIGRPSLLVQELQIKNYLESSCYLGYWLSAATLTKSDAVPKMLISCKTGLKARYKGHLNHMLTMNSRCQFALSLQRTVLGMQGLYHAGGYFKFTLRQFLCPGCPGTEMKSDRSRAGDGRAEQPSQPETLPDTRK